MAQTLDVKNKTIDRDWIIKNEGDFWGIGRTGISNWNGTSAPPSTTYGTNFFNPILAIPYGQTGVLKSISISSDGPCVFVCHISKGGINQPLTSYTTNPDNKIGLREQIVFGANGGRHIIEYSDGMDLYENGQISIGFFATSTVQPIVTFFPDASLYTSDNNFSAKNVLIALGDSITWTELGVEAGTAIKPNYGDTHYSGRIANLLRKQDNFDLRVSRRGFGGSTSNQWYDYIQSGAIDRTLLSYYDPSKSRVCVTIGLGTNDAQFGDASTVVTSTGQYTQGTTYRIRIEKIISRIYSKCPNASVILLGPPDTDLTDRAANIPSYRAMLQTIISEGLASGGAFVGKDLKYYDQSTGLAVNNANYKEQGTNVHLHPRGDTGHAIIATGDVNGAGTTGLLAVVKTTNFYLNNV